MTCKYLKNRVAVLLVTFVIGVGSYLLVQPPVMVSDIPTQAEWQRDELHRLYEAAMVSRDQDLRNGIVLRLQCVDAYNTFVAPVEWGLNCSRSNEQLEIGFTEMRNSHEEWVLRNMDFVRKINTAEKARVYFNEHQNLAP